jgi:hypothetical protein
MRRNFAVVGEAAIIAVAAGCTSNASESAGADTDDEDVAFQLATVANGGYPSDSDVTAFREGLAAAESVCTQTRERIADMVVVGVDSAAEYGAHTTHLEMLRAIPTAVPAEMRPTDCAEMIALIVTMMAA